MLLKKVDDNQTLSNLLVSKSYVTTIFFSYGFFFFKWELIMQAFFDLSYLIVLNILNSLLIKILERQMVTQKYLFLEKYHKMSACTLVI